LGKAIAVVDLRVDVIPVDEVIQRVADLADRERVEKARVGDRHGIHEQIVHLAVRLHGPEVRIRPGHRKVVCAESG
jgi:hypothetical protein